MSNLSPVIVALNAIEAFLRQEALSSAEEQSTTLAPGERNRGGKSPSPLTAAQRNEYSSATLAEITHFRDVLNQRPELLAVFEKSIRDEYDKRARGSVASSFAVNAICTVVGALLGILLQANIFK